MTTPIRVVIADDHQLMLDGLKQGLDSLPDIHVVGTAVDGTALGDVVVRTGPDVLLVDVEMPGMSGLSAISRLDDLPPTIVVTMHTAEAYGKSAREAGAVAFLSKALPLPDLAAAIRAVADGQHLFDHDLDQILADYRTPQLSMKRSRRENAMCCAASSREYQAPRTSPMSSTSRRRP